MMEGGREERREGGREGGGGEVGIDGEREGGRERGMEGGWREGGRDGEREEAHSIHVYMYVYHVHDVSLHMYISTCKTMFLSRHTCSSTTAPHTLFTLS